MLHKGPRTPWQLGGIMRVCARDARTEKSVVQIALVSPVERLQQVPPQQAHWLRIKCLEVRQDLERPSDCAGH